MQWYHRNSEFKKKKKCVDSYLPLLVAIPFHVARTGFFHNDLPMNQISVIKIRSFSLQFRSSVDERPENNVTSYEIISTNNVHVLINQEQSLLKISSRLVQHVPFVRSCQVETVHFQAVLNQASTWQLNEIFDQENNATSLLETKTEAWGS